MMNPLTLQSSLLTLVSTLALVCPASAQVPGVSREQMWPAPTAEDWARPCLVTFQRTYEDALAVSKETGRPILVCVNMDGEIASEHYAGIRYREPETAALYDPYVCVIASVYRHTPGDFDENGQRVLCPRFGSVTCGEHIAIEPGVYDRFLDGQRVAPRHIGVELDGEEMYDVYYAFDTDSVFETIREGAPDLGPEPSRADRPLDERIRSAHVADREAVEQAYLEGDREARRALLEGSIALGPDVSVDLMRLAVFGLDVELAKVARRGLTRSRSAKAVPLIAEALRVPMEPAEREALLTALDEIGVNTPRARAVAVVHRGLERHSELIDPAAWFRAWSESEVGVAALAERPEPEAWLERAGEALARAEAGSAEEAAARLEFGLASAAVAWGHPEGTHRELLLEDARASLRSAGGGRPEGADAAAPGWRALALGALLAELDGNPREARELATAAVAGMEPGRADPASARVLQLCAQGRQRGIRRAYMLEEPIDPAWITDVHATYTVLAKHPWGSADQAADHYDFLRWFGAGAVADGVLDSALERFGESWMLHDRLRARILRERGADDLEEVYRDVLSRAGASPNLEWFAGYTSIVSAEFHRRGGRDEESRAAYDRAIEHLEASARENPETEASAAHYVAMALGGRARLALERGQLDEALADVLAAFERSPLSAATLDGLNVNAVGTAQMIHARLMKAHRAEDALLLGDALDRLGELNPALLELPAFEQGGGGNRRRSWPQRRDR